VLDTAPIPAVVPVSQLGYVGPDGASRPEVEGVAGCGSASPGQGVRPAPERH
jgi:hypothetical protein